MISRRTSRLRKVKKQISGLRSSVPALWGSPVHFIWVAGGTGSSVLDPSNQAGGALVGLSPEKIEPQVLSHEINRLIRLADIRLETGAVIDFANTRRTAGEGGPCHLGPDRASRRF